MNAAQPQLVQTTFARLAVMPEVAGALFYERLFATIRVSGRCSRTTCAFRRQADDHARHGRLQFT